MSRVIIDRQAAKNIEEANGGHVLVRTKDGTTYRYGSDGVLRRVTPKGGRTKKERRQRRERVRALLAKQHDQRDFAKEAPVGETELETRAQATYPVTVKDRIERFCPSCQKAQFIYVMREPNALVEKTCCTVCSYIIETKAVDGI